MLAGVSFLCIVDIEQLLPGQILELDVRSDLCAVIARGERGLCEHGRGRFRARRPHRDRLRDAHGQCDIGVGVAARVMRGESLSSRSTDFGLVACQKRRDRDVQHDGTVIGRDHGVGIAHGRAC